MSDLQKMDTLKHSNIEAQISDAIARIQELDIPFFDPREGGQPDPRQMLSIPGIKPDQYDMAVSSIKLGMQSGKIAPNETVRYSGNVKLDGVSIQFLQYWAPYFKSMGVDFWRLIDNFPGIAPNNEGLVVPYENPFDHEKEHLKKVLEFGGESNLDIAFRPWTEGPSKGVVFVGMRVRGDQLQLNDPQLIEVGLAPKYPGPNDIMSVMKVAQRSNQLPQLADKLIEKFKGTGAPLFDFQVQAGIPKK